VEPLTHLLATRLLIGREPVTLLAGIAPDLAFYSTYPLWVLRNGRIRAVLDGGTWPAPPPWMVQLHRATHSIPIALLGAMLIRFSSGRWPLRALGAYLLHLLIDIPTHTRDPWGPWPFWPFSNIAYDGVGWAETLTHVIQTWRQVGAQSSHPHA
jgi:membrane-bound metal-dependent hydrolase YbcI (DUF457 family)